ncbi:MAG: phosphoenolpyruvate carboxylase [Microbacteriaceae bacterium]|jgi:phosphoenolpyruvate carboxylase|nr:phosphoenolpyruvate carboxylase [Microbacteriaceae bacterium]
MSSSSSTPSQPHVPGIHPDRTPDGEPERLATGAIRAAEDRAEAGSELPAELRADVRLLGELLGRVLAEAGGDELLADVERLRALTISAFNGGPTAFDEAEALVESFTLERADEVARAFTCYFHLVNLAEEHHRVRVLRRRDTQIAPQEDTIARAMATLTREVGEAPATARARALRFHPVFTAHPTEARRRAVSSTIRRISAILDECDGALTGPVAVGHRRRLLEQIDTLWRTSPLRAEKPEPLDEVRTAMAVFDETLFTVVPQVYRRLDEELQGGDSGRAAPLARSFIRVGSWIGGDRDGNPFVTAKVTREAAAIAAEHVLRGLERAASRIGRTLTLAADTTPLDAEATALLGGMSALDEAAAGEIAQRSPGEPHRVLLLLIARRIEATRTRNADLAYRDAAELLGELRILQASLHRASAARHAFGELQHLIWQVETFGFHLTELEVRQHSQVHRAVLAELAQGEASTDLAREVLEVFRAIAFVQHRHGPRAAGRYIVSFTQSAADLAAVYRLAEHAAAGAGRGPELTVIPLFETFADLQAAPRILAEMLEIPEVAQRLARGDRRLEVMLGYSDSSKDVGPVAATLALYEAQEQIAAWARANAIELTLFHGRGGALGRGGGPANVAILAQPPHSVDGRFKLTEQGEVIFARYGDPEIARRHIEQVASATLLASAPGVEERNASAAREFAPMAQAMDAASRARFFELVHAPGFAPWFATVTPMEEIGLLALGSRPARRGLSVESLEDLRAIPWVFAWTQARVNLTGWFGLGAALEAIGDVDRLRTAYARWPLFRTMIDNVAMSLAKTDARIARRYLALGDRDELAQLVMDEMALTRLWVTTITGGTELLDDKPVLQRAVKMRSPYVDALSLMQLRALRGLRGVSAQEGPEASAARLRRLLLLTVNGVAAGLQNTG